MIQSKKYDAIFLNYYKEIISFTKDCFIGQSTHNLDYTNENFLLNRHGILHGDSTHLKAGTELNALKILSLLLFVDFLIRGVETYKIEVAKQSLIVGNDKNN
ncbi:hypothetical protein P256_00241 [Acinetobacter nectaris CIP 110549]|uniref:Uncharacterized protein n=1 Tax=Acinetobacter nectaris CIP 110549 TaxID=1392540 RepID=V2TUK1_9GAMM|nr:hypothetical protein [Acinetobacter nectaris]ESK41252.1 hypothetical protein P256_00241 [Acinetobacter nectaris CIP 110549]